MFSLRVILSLCLLVGAVVSMGYYSSNRVNARCSRLCPCYYKSLFCRGYKYGSIPADVGSDIQNIDFQENHLTVIQNDTLSRFPQLRKLLLGNNRISHIDRGAFSKQRFLNALDLSSNELAEIPGDVFSPIRKRLEHLTLQDNAIDRVEGMFQKMRILKTLNLKDNRLKVLTAETLFQNRKLRYLQLSNNNISYISPEAFRRQYDLNYLFLDNNKLENVTKLRLPSKKLQTLSMINCGMRAIPTGISRVLRQLNFAGNQLRTLNGTSLSTLRNLERLDLSRNSIESICPKCVRHLSKLKVLYMSSNKLQAVPRKLPGQLDQLSLDHNLISDLPKEAFSRLKKLTTLALNNNMIEYIHKKVFNGLTQLQSLDLSSNVITRINSHLFKGLTGLKDLYLSNNPLLAIESGAMDGLWSLDTLSMDNLGSDIRLRGVLLPDSSQLRSLNIQNSAAVTASILKWDLPMYHLRSVKYLNIMQNNLKTLPATFPQYLPNIQRIQLSNNPWLCTRDMYWLKVWLINGLVEEPHLLSIYCDLPRYLRGRQLIDLDTYDWVSSDNAIVV